MLHSTYAVVQEHLNDWDKRRDKTAKGYESILLSTVKRFDRRLADLLFKVDPDGDGINVEDNPTEAIESLHVLNEFRESLINNVVDFLSVNLEDKKFNNVDELEHFRFVLSCYSSIIEAISEAIDDGILKLQMGVERGRMTKPLAREAGEKIRNQILNALQSEKEDNGDVGLGDQLFADLLGSMYEAIVAE